MCKAVQMHSDIALNKCKKYSMNDHCTIILFLFPRNLNLLWTSVFPLFVTLLHIKVSWQYSQWIDPCQLMSPHGSWRLHGIGQTDIHSRSVCVRVRLKQVGVIGNKKQNKFVTVKTVAICLPESYKEWEPR